MFEDLIDVRNLLVRDLLEVGQRALDLVLADIPILLELSNDSWPCAVRCGY